MRKKGLSYSPPREGSGWNKRLCKGPEGFSLLEILIGLVFLSIGLLAMAGLQVSSIRGNYFSQNLAHATYLAHNGLESLKALPYDDARLVPNTYHLPDQKKSELVFHLSYTVTQEGSLRRIDYTVRWNDGNDHSITLSTRRAP